MSVRDLPFFRDPAVIMIDQLKEVYIDGELEMIDTANWLPKVMRKDYTVGFSAVGGGPDPDNNLYLNYGCGGELNYNGYCNPEVDKLIDRNPSRPTWRGARSWCGKSKGNWQRTAPDRLSFTTAARLAGSPM